MCVDQHLNMFVRRIMQRKEKRRCTGEGRMAERERERELQHRCPLECDLCAAREYRWSVTARTPLKRG